MEAEKLETLWVSCLVQWGRSELSPLAPSGVFEFLINFSAMFNVAECIASVSARPGRSSGVEMFNFVFETLL